MGEYFLISKHFNKQNASDFGLIPNDENFATNPYDKSIWIKVNLYDFGWGKENGYYKHPLPDFLTLFEMVLYSENEDDVYGAAAIILEQYPEELLIQCEKLMVAQNRKNDFRKLSIVFKLNIEINRSPVLNKTYDQIQNDFERWKKVSAMANNIG